LIDERPPIPSSSTSQALPPARRGTPTLPPHPSSSGISKPLITTLPHAPNIPFSELTTAITPASTLVQEEKAHHTVRGARGRFVPLNPETTSSRTTRDLLSITAKSPTAGETLSLDAEPATNSKGGVGEKVKDKMLWVCDGCFKYLRTLAGYTNHTVRWVLSRSRRPSIDSSLIVILADRLLAVCLTFSEYMQGRSSAWEEGLREGQLQYLGGGRQFSKGQYYLRHRNSEWCCEVDRT
jgi:hypothetical protein